MMLDLRSDTVTTPTAAMRRAMAEAEVGDDVFSEDPTVNRLEATVASFVGMEAALYVPSGTMANQIAIHLHTRPGESVICEQDAHIYLYEAGAGAALSGVQFELIPWADEFSDEAIHLHYKAPGLHSADATLLAVENTHNRRAGKVLALPDLKRIVRTARSLNLKVHCDGARLWNAAAALKTSEKDLLEGFDTVSVCFSKGLGAPVGSALCGPKDFIARARKIRKRWGGGMRQAGILAAGALHALEHHRARLHEDHDRMAALVSGLRSHFGAALELRYPEPGTNICYFRVRGWDGDAAAAQLGKAGVRVMHLGEGWVRLVTHLQVDDEGVATFLRALKTF